MDQVRLYDYSDYKSFVNDWIISHPNSGRGKYLEISKYLSVHTTLTSQVFKGERDLSHDQAFMLCEYLGFNELETEYFLCLISMAKAGNFKLKKFYGSKKEELGRELSKLKNIVNKKKKLDQEQKALFYSNWFYSAIRLITSVEGVHTKEKIADKLGLPLKTVAPVVDFLVSVSLLKEENGQYQIGPTMTYLDPDSPLISNHHRNWRMKAIEKHANLSEEEFCFTGPLTINKDDAAKVKKLLKETIGQISEIVQNSDDVDSLYAVNIDWFTPVGRVLS